MRPDCGRQSRCRGWSGASDTGSGTIWVLTLCILVWFCALTVVTVAGVRTDRHRAATAADLAALSGARQAGRGPDSPCVVAREIAGENGAHLADCVVAGRTVSVEVRVPARAWPGGEVSARARAGPVRSI